ncbi:unnamed protein product [Calypogeia fissa]
MESLDLSPGDAVLLITDGTPIGRGIVVCTGADDTCHNIRIGDFRVSISISEAYFVGNALFYPHGGADTVGEAIGSIVMWDRQFAQMYQLVRKKISSPDFDPSVHQNSGRSSSNAPGLSNESLPRDQTQRPSELVLERSCWFRREALLYAADRVTLLAHGRIANCKPDSSVNDEKLGEQHCGISLLKIVLDNVESRKRISLFVEGTPCPVKWPLMEIKLPPNLEFLGDIGAFENPRVDYLPFSHPKRGPYNNQNRKPISKEEKQRRASETRQARKRTSEEINVVYTKDCCKAECCKKFDREVVINHLNN